MAERTIVGVDFSGAQTDGKTWVAEGRLLSGEQLLLDHVQPILRKDLRQFLQSCNTSTVVALDFPFGLPRIVLESLKLSQNWPMQNLNNMRDVWPLIARMGLDDYKVECKKFSRHHKRTGDKHYSVSLSVLNSRMVSMTYRGIELLHELHEECPDPWWIPPLDLGETPVDGITLLEVMPGAFLWSIGLDYSTVKSYKGKDSLDTRRAVIDRISEHAEEELRIPNLNDFRWGLRANDDCLDAVVAAVAAGLWAKDKARFFRPEDNPEPAMLKDAQLEGWIYAPKK